MNKKLKSNVITGITIIVAFVLSILLYTGYSEVDIKGNIVFSFTLACSIVITGLLAVKMLWKEIQKFIQFLESQN